MLQKKNKNMEILKSKSPSGKTKISEITDKEGNIIPDKNKLPS